MGSFLRICRDRNEEDRHQSDYCFQHRDLPGCLRGSTHPTCRTVIGCSGTPKESNFESTLTRSHLVDKTAGTRTMSEGTGRQLVSWSAPHSWVRRYLSEPATATSC